MLAPNPKAKDQFETILFVQKRDETKEIWEGERYGTEGAMKVFGADRAFEVENFEKEAPEILKHADRLFYRTGMNESMDREIFGLLEKVRKLRYRSGACLLPIHDPGLPLGEMRLFKSKDEIELMQMAADISAEAHCEAIKQIRPGMRESELEAILEYTFKRRGCDRHGYPSIVREREKCDLPPLCS